MMLIVLKSSDLRARTIGTHRFSQNILTSCHPHDQFTAGITMSWMKVSDMAGGLQTRHSAHSQVKTGSSKGWKVSILGLTRSYEVLQYL